MKLSKQIRKVRIQTKASQKDFAEKLGISRIHYCGIENGRFSPTIDLLIRISKITGTPLVVCFVDKDSIAYNII